MNGGFILNTLAIFPALEPLLYLRPLFSLTYHKKVIPTASVSESMPVDS